MEEVKCIFCNATNHEIAIRENGFTGVRCRPCNLIYISPRPSGDEIKKLYTDEHAVLYADAQFQFDSFNRMEAAKTLSLIRPYQSSGSLLEIGAGGGCFLLEAAASGYKAFGIEVNPIEAGWINDTLKIPCESEILTEKSFGGRHFDVVYHRDVLSHLPDPVPALESMNRALRDGGLLAFETGNIADVKEKYLKYFAQFSYPDHLFFYGEASLKTLLERTGFQVLRIYRSAILIQLLLQKLLWPMKESLKDRDVQRNMRSGQLSPKHQAVTLKRRLRLAYRYARHSLVQCGAILPKQGRPLKLLVVARKISGPPFHPQAFQAGSKLRTI